MRDSVPTVLTLVEIDADSVPTVLTLVEIDADSNLMGHIPENSILY